MPYDVRKVAAIRLRSERGNNFSIVAVAEGAKSVSDSALFDAALKKKKAAKTKEQKDVAKRELAALEGKHVGNTMRLAKELEQLTKLEARVSILGYVQRGGTPSCADRLLATRLGSACAHLLAQGAESVMVAARGDGYTTVPMRKSPAHLNSCHPITHGSPRPAASAPASAIEPALRRIVILLLSQLLTSGAPAALFSSSTLRILPPSGSFWGN